MCFVSKRATKVYSTNWGGVIAYSLGWSGCGITVVEWFCVHCGGVVVYSMGWSDCVFTRVEWWWNDGVFTGVE